MVHVIIWTFVRAIAIVFVTHAYSSSYTSSTSMSNTTVVFSVGRTEQAMTSRETGCIIHGRSLLTLSTTPRYLLLPLSDCPTPHFYKPTCCPWSRETIPGNPPPHRDVKHSMWMGRGWGCGSVGVEVWRHHSDTTFWGKEKIRVKGKGRHFFRKSSLRCRFLSIRKARNRLLRCQC